MQKTYKVEGMTCGGCKASVEKTLNSLENVKDVTVDLENGEATINMKKHISVDELQVALTSKYQISEKKEPKSIQKEIPEVALEEDEKSTLRQLFPLFLIFGYITVTSILINRNSLSLESFMLDFMGLFYIVFSFFKFLDLRGFALSFSMYDPLAKQISGYGFVYPFIELTLGLFFLFRFQVDIALIATLVILGITTIGVTKALLDKKSIQCACLGSVLNLPMTKATFIENSIMIVMAVFMLVK